MAKDFFDEEYDKLNEQDQQDQQEFNFGDQQQENGNDEQGGNYYNDSYQTLQDNYNNWSSVPPQFVQQSHKPWKIVLTAVLLVVALALGWVLCVLFGYNGGLTEKEEEVYAKSIVDYIRSEYKIEITDEQLQEALNYASGKMESGEITAVAQREQLLGTVFDYIYKQFLYTQIDADVWDTAVSNAGTALLQTTGDRYSSLMSPTDYYLYRNPTATTTTTVTDYPGKLFGMSFQAVSGVGMYVSSIVDNTSAFGKLQVGDIIVKLSDIKDREGQVVRYVPYGGNVYSIDTKIVLGNYITDFVSAVLAKAYSATFYVLRNGDVQQISMQRNAVGFTPAYDFSQIEFYFGDDCTNLSTTNINGASTNSKQARCLDQLPQDTGYVRIVEFMDGVNRAENVVSASEEFAQVMQIFKEKHLKRLVLDLKGNPGGRVDYVCDIASRLITLDKLSSADQSKVKIDNKLCITKLVDRNGKSQTEALSSKYYDYFGELSNKCDIIVWTDGNSASASELLTGCLLDYGTAIQMGTRTYGKGIAQTIKELNVTGNVYINGNVVATAPWAMYYTFAKYYSPLGTNIHGQGYTPSTYDNLTTYSQLWQAVRSYWGV